MNNSTNNTESKVDSTKETKTNEFEKANTPPVDNQNDDKLDEFGYEKDTTKIIETKKEDDKNLDPKIDEEEKVIKPTTGYGKDDPKLAVDDKKPIENKEEPKPGEETEEAKFKKEIAEVFKDLSDGYDKEKITKFALENKLNKAQVEAYVKLTKEEDAALVEKQKQLVKEQRSKWHNELRNDPEFGGENFEKNVDRVEKVLQKFLPDTKKVLTERGSMLPPYIMRDFLRLSKVLNPTTKLVSGEAKELKEEKSNFLDEMYS